MLSVLISIRATATKKVVCEKVVLGVMGPTWITKWIMRQAASVGLATGAYEYRIGKKGAWQS